MGCGGTNFLTKQRGAIPNVRRTRVGITLLNVTTHSICTKTLAKLPNANHKIVDTLFEAIQLLLVLLWFRVTITMPCKKN